ncbi:MAG: Growth inhibitor [Bacillota bacterium]|jgi:mRNA interferase MazF|nr:Growth inhibitor [Bacillota bacterium]
MKQCKNMELWTAEIPIVPGHVQHGRRPVLIVSNNTANKHSPVVTVVPLTGQLKKTHLPTHVFLRGCGLSRSSIACCEQVMTLDKSCLGVRMGEITDWFDCLSIRHALAVQFDFTA